MDHLIISYEFLCHTASADWLYFVNSMRSLDPRLVSRLVQPLRNSLSCCASAHGDGYGLDFCPIHLHRNWGHDLCIWLVWILSFTMYQSLAGRELRSDNNDTWIRTVQRSGGYRQRYPENSRIVKVIILPNCWTEKNQVSLQRCAACQGRWFVKLGEGRPEYCCYFTCYEKASTIPQHLGL